MSNNRVVFGVENIVALICIVIVQGEVRSRSARRQKLLVRHRLTVAPEDNGAVSKD